jgi:5-methylphenazine-1-carboxylate 1-monooxygenase
MRAIVIGAGIGGLTAALALHRAGIEVQVYESVPELRPLGVGINLLPHSVRVLDALGALDPLLPISVQPEAFALFTRHGQEVWREQRGTAAGYRWPQLSVHRGELQMALLKTVQEALPAGAVATGHHLARWRQDAQGVLARLVDLRTGTVLLEDEADLMIAADGIHSAVRASLYPQEGPPVWNGALIYRGVTETELFLGGRTQVMIGGRQTFIAYPIRRVRGRALTNWAARFFVDRAHGHAREDWNRLGETDQVLPRYRDWRFGWLDVPGIVAGADAMFEYPMVDRDPIPRWSFARVTLLGDAAHPMYPLGSNGASQAVLDAAALAAALRGARDVERALAEYEAARRPATAQVVAMNRAGGPEVVVTMVEERAPEGFEDLEQVMPHAERAAIAAKYKQAAGFQVEAVNQGG